MKAKRKSKKQCNFLDYWTHQTGFGIVNPTELKKWLEEE
jgi:hypothetical protein